MYGDSIEERTCLAVLLSSSCSLGERLHRAAPRTAAPAWSRKTRATTRAEAGEAASGSEVRRAWSEYRCDGLSQEATLFLRLYSLCVLHNRNKPPDKVCRKTVAGLVGRVRMGRMHEAD